MREFSILIPRAINFNELIASDKERFKNINLDVVKGILGLISIYLSYKIYDDETIKEPYNVRVYLYSLSLKDIFGNDYKLALELLHRKVLFKYPYSEKDGIPFSFSYNPKILKEGVKIETINSSTTKGRNIIKNLHKHLNKIDSKTKMRFNFLIKFLNSKRLKIDTESAFKEIQDDFKKDNNLKEYISKIQKVLNIDNGIYHITYKPETDGRFHNNFVRLNKKLRKHLTYDGKKLVEIDISNSIPFILSCVLNNSININLDLINKSNTYNKLSYKFQKISEDFDTIEIQRFHKLCASGKLYEHIIKPYSKKVKTLDMILDYIDEDGVEHYKHDRKKVKQEVLSMIFARNASKTYKEMQLVFKELYPSVFYALDKCKRKYYKRLSHFLLQIESYLILDEITRKFNKINRGRIPILTVHDCIVTTEDNIELLTLFINEKSNEIFTSYKPKFKIEPW